MGHSSTKRGHRSHDCGQLSEAKPERVIAFLRRIHPIKTAEAVSADTGVQASTVRKWLERASAPSFAALFRLLGAYGPEFVCACMNTPPEWLSEAARKEEARRLRAEIDALTARLEAQQ
jgi:transcriptional regulator with XRE-family HTH domain